MAVNKLELFSTLKQAELMSSAHKSVALYGVYTYTQNKRLLRVYLELELEIKLRALYLKLFRVSAIYIYLAKLYCTLQH